MNETTIMLSPSPGDPRAKPDFLATVEPLVPREPPFALPFELVLDGYTREPWSRGESNRSGDQHGDSKEWQSCYLVSTDGRKRLPGFMKYLQGRKKAAVAKFEATESLQSSGPAKAILVVPHDPPPIPAEDLPGGVDASQVIFVKYLRDENILKKGSNDPQKQKQQQQLKILQQHKIQQQQIQQQRQTQQQKQHQAAQQKNPPPSASSNKKGGFLGNLLGAQRRTENHLDVVRSKKSSGGDYDPNTGAAGCINAFRKKVSADLERFKSDPTTFETKVTIELASMVKSVPMEERDKVTLDVFKFTVYEQVEEVGMDRWIAVKEPSEFLDECVIAVYKEGHAPAEVLEDHFKGEMPDEMKGQARHLAETQSKVIQKKDKKKSELAIKQSMAEDNVVVLNSNKRDRRTLEQIQRDLSSEDAKRGRFD
ncbi:hypothetical protein ACHAWF_003496 [Thalassiosira exigua]